VSKEIDLYRKIENKFYGNGETGKITYYTNLPICAEVIATTGVYLGFFQKVRIATPPLPKLACGIRGYVWYKRT